jgi:hypothetical protein
VGSELVDLAANEIPERLKKNLEAAFTRGPDYYGEAWQPQVQEISKILFNTLSNFDDDIRSDLMDLLPNGQESLTELSNEEIKQMINDHSRGGKNYGTVMRSICGTTALIGLIDPNRKNLWIANLGDCQASEPLDSQSKLKPSLSHPTFSAWHGVRGR